MFSDFFGISYVSQRNDLVLFSCAGYFLIEQGYFRSLQCPDRKSRARLTSRSSVRRIVHVSSPVTPLFLSAFASPLQSLSLFLSLCFSALVRLSLSLCKICCRGNPNSRRSRSKCIHDHWSASFCSRLPFWCPPHFLSGISNFWRFLGLCCICLLGQFF